MSFKIRETALKNAFVIDYFSVGDLRGGFSKVFEKEIYSNAGIEFCLNESFFSVSAKNVIRGLHFQKNNPQAKIVSVVRGRVWDVIVDLRVGSTTFGRWIAEELSSKNHKALYVPRGFAHGFASLEDDSIVFYQCDGKYDKESDTGIRYDDPEIGICWPVDNRIAIHSERDLELESLSDYMLNPIKMR